VPCGKFCFSVHITTYRTHYVHEIYAFRSEDAFESIFSILFVRSDVFDDLRDLRNGAFDDSPFCLTGT
jgi:hypothetical protein